MRDPCPMPYILATSVSFHYYIWVFPRSGSDVGIWLRSKVEDRSFAKQADFVSFLTEEPSGIPLSNACSCVRGVRGGGGVLEVNTAGLSKSTPVQRPGRQWVTCHIQNLASLSESSTQGLLLTGNHPGRSAQGCSLVQAKREY